MKNVYSDAYTEADDSISNPNTMNKIDALIDARYAETTNGFIAATSEGIEPNGKEYQKLHDIIKQSQDSIAASEKQAVRTLIEKALEASPPTHVNTTRTTAKDLDKVAERGRDV